MQILEVTDMKTLRRIINKTRRDGMRNESIRETCGIQNITLWVQRRRTERSMRISRMAEDRQVRKVHDGIPEGKRTPRSTDEKMERRTGITDHRPNKEKKKMMQIKVVYLVCQ